MLTGVTVHLQCLQEYKMQQVYLTRQADLIKPEHLTKRIVIIGAGAVGSFTALTLAKMGFKNITVYDGDTIDPENMNCQFYPISAIGKSKVLVLQKLIQEFTDVTIKAVNDMYVPDTHGPLRGDVLVSAVDSMAVRRMVFENCMCTHLLDARMGAEYIQTYHVFSDSSKMQDNYKASLYTDAEAVQERCTAKATMYTVNLIAGLLGKAVKDIATNELRPIESLDWNVKQNSAVWFTDGTKLTQ